LPLRAPACNMAQPDTIDDRAVGDDMGLPLVVGISGASGVVYGVRLLELLKAAGVPAHLIVSRSAVQTLKEETDWTVEAVRALAEVSYSNSDMGAAISSGSFKTRGMIVIPCSVRSLADVAHGGGDSLIGRDRKSTRLNSSH